jgi:integrase
MLQVTETVYDGHFDQPKTRKSRRVIPIGPDTVRIIERFCSMAVEPEALVFGNGNGKPLDRQNLLNRSVKPACTTLGLTGISWHSFRHCNATLLDSAGTPLGTVQSLLGHATPEMTRSVYLHAVRQDQRQAVRRVEKSLFGPKRTQVRRKVDNGQAVSA